MRVFLADPEWRRGRRLVATILRRLPALALCSLLLLLAIGLWIRVERTVDVAGEVRLRRFQIVRPEFDARVSRMAVVAGDVVNAGQVLLSFESAELESERLATRAEQVRLGQQVASLQAEYRLLEKEIHPGAMQAARQQVEQQALRALADESRALEAGVEMAAARSGLGRRRKLAAAGLLASAAIDQAEYAVAALGERHQRRRVELELGHLETAAARQRLGQLAGAQALVLLQLERRRLELEVAREESMRRAREIEAQLARGVVRAEISGVVAYADDPAPILESASLEGRRVRSGEALLVVIDPNAVELESALPESALIRVRAGQQARITLDGLPRRRFGSFAATVASVSPLPMTASGEGATGRYPVRLRLERPWVDLEGGRFVLRGGMKGRAEIAYRPRLPLLGLIFELLGENI